MFSYIFIRYHIILFFKFLFGHIEIFFCYVTDSIHDNRFYSYKFTILSVVLFYYLFLKYIMDENYLQVFLLQAIHERHPEPADYREYVEEGSKHY